VKALDILGGMQREFTGGLAFAKRREKRTLRSWLLTAYPQKKEKIKEG